MVNVGLVTGSSTPSARAAPRTNVVLPAPRSPATSTTSPGRRSTASAAPSASVCSAEVVLLRLAPQARAQADAGEQEPAPGEGEEPCLGPRARELLPGRTA